MPLLISVMALFADIKFCRIRVSDMRFSELQYERDFSSWLKWGILGSFCTLQKRLAFPQYVRKFQAKLLL